jgi:hypothetical protein
MSTIIYIQDTSIRKESISPHTSPRDDISTQTYYDNVNEVTTTRLRIYNTTITEDIQRLWTPRKLPKPTVSI